MPVDDCYFFGCAPSNGDKTEDRVRQKAGLTLFNNSSNILLQIKKCKASCACFQLAHKAEVNKLTVTANRSKSASFPRHLFFIYLFFCTG